MITKLFGLAGLVGCLCIIYMFESSSMFTGAMRIFHWPALVLTGIGPMALVLTCSDFGIMFRTLGRIIGKSPLKLQRIHEREAVFLQRLGQNFYAEGPKVFEDVKAKGISSFVLKVIERLAVRIPFPDIRELLETERDHKQAHLRQSINVVGMGVRLAPSVGMLGTIMGMVQLLSTLEDPSKIGSNMSLALLTTFFGLFFSLAVWTPFQQKLERVLEVEVEGYNQLIVWLEFLERRKPADYFTDSVEILQKKSQAPRAAGAAGAA